MAAELIRHTSRIGVESHLGVFDNGGRGDRSIIGATEAFAGGHVIVPSRGQFDRAAVRAIAHYARAHRIDIVHSHKYKTTFHALLARRRGGFRLVSTYHNWLNETRSLRLYALIDKQLARFCDAAIGVSEPVARELARFVPARRVFHIENGIDLERFQPPDSRAAARAAIGLGLGERPVIGFVGRLTAQKGVADLIDALAISQRSHPADVLIVGDGEERAALEARAARADFGDRIRFLGSRRDTPALYGAMDLFVLPSLVEAFPMVLLEAMACEVPVIATPIGDIPRIVTAGTGWITPQQNAAQLSDRLSAALSDIDALHAMGRRGRAHVLENFSAERMAQRYRERYEALLPI